MNILVVTHRFPYPPTDGARVRVFNVIKHLNQNHNVTVAAPARSQEEMRAAEGIAPFCHTYLVERIGRAQALAGSLATAPTARPASMAYFHSPMLEKRILETARETRFDLIFVQCSSAAPYVHDIPGVPKILDFADMDSQKWLEFTQHHRFPKNFVYWLEGIKLRRAEKALATEFDYCTLTTRLELETLRSYGVATPSDWFPNGVDLEFFTPSAAAYDPNLIVFIGRMDYYPNEQAMADFCRDVLPRVQAQRPEAKLTIVGADPTPAVRKLAERPGVTVTGTVPDVRPYVTRAAVNVAPLRIARGTQNKILESLAMGVPVVTTPIAAKGVDAVPGEHLLACTGAEEMAQEVLRLLDDPDARSRYAKNGRARMESHHTWAVAMARLDRIIEDCLQRSGRPAARERALA